MPECSALHCETETDNQPLLGNAYMCETCFGAISAVGTALLESDSE